MNIFISWSGERSRQTAESLRVWLPRVIQSIRPWMSEHDLGKGSCWSSTLSRELEDHTYGIICVTPENREKPWLNFEAGALSKSDTSRTYTLLLGLSYSDVEQPLAQFNHTVANEKDVLELTRSINASLSTPLTEDILTSGFALNWPYLRDRFDEIVNLSVPSNEGSSVAPRDERSMIEEILRLTRAQVASLPINTQEADAKLTVHMVHGILEDELRLQGIRATGNVHPDQRGNFQVMIAPSSGGSIGMTMSGAIAAIEVRDRLRSTLESLRMNLARADSRAAS